MNNLKKLIVFSSVLAASQIMSTAAMALPPPTGVLNGTVVATKGITLTCDLKLTLGSGTGSIEMNPGDANCAALVFNNMPYTTSYDSVNDVLTFHSVDVTTITLGDCAGDISGTWDGTTLTISGAVLPPKTGGPACTVDGFAS